MNSVEHLRPQAIVSRLAALFIGPWYLLGLAFILAQLTGVLLSHAVVVVGLAAIAIIAVLVIFSVKVYQQQGPVRQFRLSSPFLLALPLAIYLSAIRVALAKVPSDIGFTGWAGIAVVCGLFVALTTAILLWLAEAIVWWAVYLLRQSR